MIYSKDFPVLSKGPLLWLGHGVLRAPYRMVRLKTPHTHVYASLEGCGRAWVGGRVVDLTPGTVLVTPAGAHYAYEIAGQAAWRTAWVFFEDTPSLPILRDREPRVLQSKVDDFADLIRMLTQEAAGLAQPAMLAALATLLDTSTRRMAGMTELDERLARLWALVESDLGRGWSCASLSAEACMSEEHLRRLCHQYYQNSPMGQLGTLRMRRAGALLRSSTAKLEEIAQQVGYASIYSFSVAFRRWSGQPPARFRRRMD